MKPPYYDNDLIQTLQLSGEYIGRSDHPEYLATWVLFLIDEVRSQVDEAEFKNMMRSLSHEVDLIWNEVNT